MSRARTASRVSGRGSLAGAALACLLALHAPANAQGAAGEGAPPDEARAVPVGEVVIPGGGSELSADLLSVLGRAVGWAADDCSAAWAALGVTVAEGSGGGDRAWTLSLDDGAIRPDPREPGTEAAPRPVAFDISMDCNAFRAGSPQPFSRTPRGRALDALTIDNARRARLAAIYPDPDDRTSLTLALFTESRAQKPGRWHAQMLATITLAPRRGEPKPPAPVQLDFGDRWEGVVFSMADLALGLDPDSDTLSSAERFEAWGALRSAGLRRLAGSFDGRVWAWPGEAEGSVVCSLTLAKGMTERRAAEGLRTVFGGRLRWAHEDSGRVTATLSLPGDGAATARTLVMRFISIADRPTLTVATAPGDLDAAATVLAGIDR